MLVNWLTGKEKKKTIPDVGYISQSSPEKQNREGAGSGNLEAG